MAMTLLAMICAAAFDPRTSNILSFVLGLMSFAYSGMLAVFLTALAHTPGKFRQRGRGADHGGGDGHACFTTAFCRSGLGALFHDPDQACLAVVDADRHDGGVYRVCEWEASQAPAPLARSISYIRPAMRPL